ncbi:hypothetical protein ADUPG1_011299 [Aduncisulcus paluster]|uniref:Uncharacterized protein n=1 Tax=Aduncisulcus paluster TaxID=2918883 RepID=A0ABQ5JVH6_9EUKA|nr:hypothetical protein ADUPG1_011299 [Aduncisulcus paluster]
MVRIDVKISSRQIAFSIIKTKQEGEKDNEEGRKKRRKGVKRREFWIYNGLQYDSSMAFIEFISIDSMKGTGVRENLLYWSGFQEWKDLGSKNQEEACIQLWT